MFLKRLFGFLHAVFTVHKGGHMWIKRGVGLAGSENSTFLFEESQGRTIYCGIPI